MKGVKVKTYTWTKDSHKLFDYECPDLLQNKISSTDSLVIARANNQIKFHYPSSGEIPADLTPLCLLKKTSDGRFFLSSANPITPLKLVIRSLKTQGKPNGYEIKAGDKIQIGRVEYFVREIKDENNNLMKAEYDVLTRNKDDMDIEESQENKICRICLEEEETNQDVQNALISPCNCKGTSRYVHIQCLKSWIKSKKQENKLENNLIPFHNSLINLIYFHANTQNNYLLRLPSQPHFRALLSNWSLNRMNSTGRVLNPISQLLLPTTLPDNTNSSIPTISNRNSGISVERNLNTTSSVINIQEPSNIAEPTSQSQSNNQANLSAPSNTQALLNIAQFLQQNFSATRPNNPTKVENNYFSNFACDVCRVILPYEIKINDGSEIEVAGIARPANIPYMILEKLSQGKESKVFSIIKGIDNNEIRLGRGHTCDVPISDISVSRWHAIIRYQRGKFMMFDNNSKFGTLVNIDKEIEIQKEKLGFQSGRTLITISTGQYKPTRQYDATDQMETSIINEEKSLSYIRRSDYDARFRNLKPSKRVQAEVKLLPGTKSKDGESEITEGVEEISPNKVTELNTRSKKIAKRK